MRHYADRIVCRQCYARRMEKMEANNGVYVPERIPLPVNECRALSIPLARSRDIVAYSKRPPRTVPSDAILCEYCKKRTNPERRSVFELFDDETTGSGTIRPVYFCNMHGSMQWVVNEDYTNLSAVIQSIHDCTHMSEKQKSIRKQLTN
jgi:hypothetical protein